MVDFGAGIGILALIRSRRSHQKHLRRARALTAVGGIRSVLAEKIQKVSISQHIGNRKTTKGDDNEAESSGSFRNIRQFRTHD